MYNVIAVFFEGNLKYLSKEYLSSVVVVQARVVVKQVANSSQVFALLISEQLSKSKTFKNKKSNCQKFKQDAEKEEASFPCVSGKSGLWS